MKCSCLNFRAALSIGIMMGAALGSASGSIVQGAALGIVIGTILYGPAARR